MIGAAIVGFAYVLLFLRFGRHALNPAFFGIAGIAMLHAGGIQLWFEEMYAGETQTWFRGAVTLFRYGEFTGAGILLMLVSLAIQALWFGLTFKSAIDAEYKSKTPAGVVPGTTPQIGGFAREVYGYLHRFLGEQSYQELDRRILSAYGSFDEEVRRRRQAEERPAAVACLMASELWVHIINGLSQRDRDRIVYGIDNMHSARLETLPRLAEHIAIAIRNVSEMAEAGQIDSRLADQLVGEIIWTAQGRTPHARESLHREREAKSARELRRDTGDFTP